LSRASSWRLGGVSPRTERATGARGATVMCACGDRPPCAALGTGGKPAGMPCAGPRPTARADRCPSRPLPRNADPDRLCFPHICSACLTSNLAGYLLGSPLGETLRRGRSCEGRDSARNAELALRSPRRQEQPPPVSAADIGT
jgi:hypothetical protein